MLRNNKNSSQPSTEKEEIRWTDLANILREMKSDEQIDFLDQHPNIIPDVSALSLILTGLKDEDIVPLALSQVWRIESEHHILLIASSLPEEEKESVDHFLATANEQVAEYQRKRREKYGCNRNSKSISYGLPYWPSPVSAAVLSFAAAIYSPAVWDNTYLRMYFYLTSAAFTYDSFNNTCLKPYTITPIANAFSSLWRSKEAKNETVQVEQQTVTQEKVELLKVSPDAHPLSDNGVAHTFG